MAFYRYIIMKDVGVYVKHLAYIFLLLGSYIKMLENFVRKLGYIKCFAFM